MAYCYSEGPASGAAAPMQAHSTLAVIELPSPATTTYGRPLTPMLWTAQLAAIDATWDAATPSGIYDWTWSSATNRLTIASGNNVQFRPVNVGNSAAWFGFTQALGAGYALTWTAASAPQAVADLLGATVEPAESWAQVDLNEYRHGRAAAIGWTNHAAHRITLYFVGENIATIQAGYVTTGRVRLWQDVSDLVAYSPTHPGGYVDGWIVAANDPTEDGDTGSLWTLSMVLAVPL